jgi:hypothetical protein
MSVRQMKLQPESLVVGAGSLLVDSRVVLDEAPEVTVTLTGSVVLVEAPGPVVVLVCGVSSVVPGLAVGPQAQASSEIRRLRAVRIGLRRDNES